MGAQESVGQLGRAVYRRLATQFYAEWQPLVTCMPKHRRLEAQVIPGVQERSCFQGINEGDQHKMERGRLAHEPQ